MSEYLFSYGSNNPKQLEERLNKKITTIIPAYYPNHILAFGSISINWLGGVATMIPSRNNNNNNNNNSSNSTNLTIKDNVFGYLTLVSKDDLVKLDVFEAVKIGKYIRKQIKVKKLDNSTVLAYAYFLTPQVIKWKRPPSQAYLEAIYKTQSIFWKKQFVVINITRADTSKIVDEWSHKIYIFNTILSKLIKKHIMNIQDQITTLSKFNIIGLKNLEAIKRNFDMKTGMLRIDIDLEITKLGYLPFKKNLQKEIEKDILKYF
jgi:hypothetical protein